MNLEKYNYNYYKSEFYSNKKFNYSTWLSGRVGPTLEDLIQNVVLTVNCTVIKLLDHFLNVKLYLKIKFRHPPIRSQFFSPIFVHLVANIGPAHVIGYRR